MVPAILLCRGVALATQIAAVTGHHHSEEGWRRGTPTARPASSLYVRKEKKMKVRIWITTAALALTASSVFAQSNRIQVAFNGQRVAFRNIQPMQEGQGTLVPLRPILTQAGAKMFWERDTNTISVVGRNRVSARIFPGRNTVQTGANEITLDAAPRIVRGHTLVPVDFFQKVFGMYTQEDLATGAVTLQTQQQAGDNQVRVLRRSPISRA